MHARAKAAPAAAYSRFLKMIRGLVRIVFAVAVAAAVTACSGSATSAGSHAKPVPASYYLALGDSLSQGVQPAATGASVETPQGYPDQLYAALHPRHPGLRLIKLGCPGETSSTMIDGGIAVDTGRNILSFTTPNAFHAAFPGVAIRANFPAPCIVALELAIKSREELVTFLWSARTTFGERSDGRIDVPAFEANGTALIFSET